MTHSEEYLNPEPMDYDVQQIPETYTKDMNSMSVAALIGGVSLSYLHNQNGGDPFVSCMIASAGTWFTIMPQWMRKDRIAAASEARENS